MTIVPPLPQDAIADAMAGTSSIEEDPPALGVHVEARALRDFVDSGSAMADAKSAKATRDVFNDMTILLRSLLTSRYIYIS